MKKKIIIFSIVSALMFFSLAGFVFAQSYNKELSLELVSPLWQNIDSGEEKTADLTVTNKTGRILASEAVLRAEYSGICSNGQKVLFEGKGIYPYFSIEGKSGWISPADFEWGGGETVFKDFEIQKGKASAFLKIKTDPLLCPGDYSLVFTIRGAGEFGTVYNGGVVIGGGGIFSPSFLPGPGSVKVSMKIPPAVKKAKGFLAGVAGTSAGGLNGANFGKRFTMPKMPKINIPAASADYPSVKGVVSNGTQKTNSQGKTKLPLLAAIGAFFGGIGKTGVLAILAALLLIILGYAIARKRS